MSRNQLPEQSPEGIDDQTWFLVHETITKIEQALNRSETRVTDIESAAGTVTPPVLQCYPIGVIGTVATATYHRLDSPPLSGHIIAATDFPSPTGAVSTATFTGDAVADRTFTWSWANHAGPAGAGIAVQILGSIPDGFGSWGPHAVELRYGLAATGLVGASTMTVGVDVNGLASHAYVHTADGAGAISTGYTQVARFTAEDMAATSWRAGEPFWFSLTLIRSGASVTNGTLTLGRFTLNWR